MTVIHPSAWIKSCLPVFSFIFFLQIFSEMALKQGLEIPSWDFILQAVKIIFIIWIINTLIYLPIERLWPIHSYCSNLNNVFKKWQNEEKLLPWGLFPGMVRQFDKFRKPDTSLKLMWEEMTQEVKKKMLPQNVSVLEGEFCLHLVSCLKLTLSPLIRKWYLNSFTQLFHPNTAASKLELWL